MRDTLRGFLSFAAILLVLLAALKLFNWAPTVLDPGGLREYPSIPAAMSSLQTQDLLVPSYFPEQVRWPPRSILAQSKPYPAMAVAYAGTRREAIVLHTTQAASAEFAPDTGIALTTLRETVPYDLEGREAILEVGVCSTGEPCSRLTWQQDRYWIKVEMVSSPFELIRIAESMRP
jgi:hypothetical protein